MTYSVKELFLTLQGEGAQAGRRAVFVRFSGCNLWSGLESDRAAAQCSFCDTEFVGTDGDGGDRFADADALASAIGEAWGQRGDRFVVFTGGEPLLQLDLRLLGAVQKRGFEVAVETNGTLVPPAGIDWLTVSPKAGTEQVTLAGDELKLVWPQAVDPTQYLAMRFSCWFLQPMDGPNYTENLAETVRYCLDNPPWRLSLQTHKMVGIR
jgi:7-carboxy-7-deazaguanine synthase